MNLHPYDNVERRYRHTDVAREVGLKAVAQVLHLGTPPPLEGVFYDLSFFSGGIGVLDRLAISLPADVALWARVAAALTARTPEAAIEDEAWAEDFIWLLTDDEDLVPPRAAAVRFINSERRPFQAECHPASRILFQGGSNVNDWAALWGDDAQLNYLGYSQG